MPDDRRVEATGPDGATTTYAAATATDAVDGDLAATCAPASGSTFALGTNTVTCSATDAAGNTGATAFTVTVVDTTGPAITVPADSTVEADRPGGARPEFEATATDLVDGSVLATCEPPSASLFGFGPTTVTCSATDEAGNTSQKAFAITVADTVAPELQLPDGPDRRGDGRGRRGRGVRRHRDRRRRRPRRRRLRPRLRRHVPPGDHPVDCTATDDHGNATVRVVRRHRGRHHRSLADAAGRHRRRGHRPRRRRGPYVVATSDLVDDDVTLACAPGQRQHLRPRHHHGRVHGHRRRRATPLPTTSPSPSWTPPHPRSPPPATRSSRPPAPTAPPRRTTPPPPTSSTATSTPPASRPRATRSSSVTTTVTCTATDAAGNTGARPPSDGGRHHRPGAHRAQRHRRGHRPRRCRGELDRLGHRPRRRRRAGDVRPARRVALRLGVTRGRLLLRRHRGNTGTGSFAVTVEDTTPPVLLTLPRPDHHRGHGPNRRLGRLRGHRPRHRRRRRGRGVQLEHWRHLPVGTSTVDCTATDEAGNTGTGSFSVTVEDTTAPGLTLPAAITVEATGPRARRSPTRSRPTISSAASCCPRAHRPPACSRSAPPPSSAAPPTAPGTRERARSTITVQDTTAPDLTLRDEIVARPPGPAAHPSYAPRRPTSSTAL